MHSSAAAPTIHLYRTSTGTYVVPAHPACTTDGQFDRYVQNVKVESGTDPLGAATAAPGVVPHEEACAESPSVKDRLAALAQELHDLAQEAPRRAAVVQDLAKELNDGAQRVQNLSSATPVLCLPLHA